MTFYAPTILQTRTGKTTEWQRLNDLEYEATGGYSITKLVYDDDFKIQVERITGRAAPTYDSFKKGQQRHGAYNAQDFLAFQKVNHPDDLKRSHAHYYYHVIGGQRYPRQNRNPVANNVVTNNTNAFYTNPANNTNPFAVFN